MSPRSASRRGSGQAGQTVGVRLDIQGITLTGYSAGSRDHFSRALAAELRGRGTPQAAAHQAAQAIVTAVDARLEQGRAPAGKGRGRA